MIGRTGLLMVSLLLPLSASAAPVEKGQLGCVLEPSMEVEVASQVPGVAKLVYVGRGSKVRQGESLVLLETSLEEAVVALANAKAKFAARKVERNKHLISQGLLSAHERDELVTEQHLAALEVREAEARLKQRTIYSPINGVVVARNINVGEYVSSDPILKLVRLNPLYAEIVMQADYYGSIKQGMKVGIKLGAPMKGQFTGTVTVVDQMIDAASATFGVRVEMPNPGFKVPAGLNCEVHFGL